MPQLTFNAFRQEIWGADFDLVSSYVDFSHPTLVNGRRAVAYPSFSLPLQTSYSFLTPKVGAHVTRYWVDANTQGLREQTRTLPIVTADAGLVFERNTSFTGMPFIQTLEPRLFYVYIPFRDQTAIPNFESGPLDVTFATMFMENQFSGHDRINDANQVTLGVKSRFIHPDSGIERLRVARCAALLFSGTARDVAGCRAAPGLRGELGHPCRAERHDPPEVDRRRRRALQHRQQQFQQFNVATRYQPAPGSVLNLAYRDTVDLVRQTDVSFQWPITPQWTALARWNYSLRDKRTLEALAGFEYRWRLLGLPRRCAPLCDGAGHRQHLDLLPARVERRIANRLQSHRCSAP